jgi:hypothetical protein
MDKICLLEIKLFDDKRKYFDETFTKIPKPIFERGNQRGLSKNKLYQQEHQGHCQHQSSR